MERLTDKYGTTKCDNVANVLKNGTTNKFVIGGKAIAKLKEFEDFMEEQGFESLEELKKCFEIWNSEDNNGFLKDTDSRKLFLYRFAKNLYRYEKEENYALKDRWQKLKDIIKKDIKHNEREFNENYIFAFEHYSTSENWVLDRMQELEKEIK